MLTGQPFVDGVYRSGGARDPIVVINPATEEEIGEIEAATEQDVDDAVAAARKAFEGGWGDTDGAQRATYLRKMADATENRLDELSRLEVLDNGKPKPEAKWDIEDAVACMRMYADLAEDLDRRREEDVPLPGNSFRSTARLEPVAVAGQIIPWNFPFLMAIWKVAPAIAAGTTMVLKPSELTSLTATKLGEIATEAALPAGVLNVLPGLGQDVGVAISNHRGIDKLAFTGSVQTGSAIMKAAARDIKSVSLELGGKSPFIVFDDADIEAAVEWIMFGIFWNKGEVCSATSRLLVQDGIADRLLDRLIEETSRIAIGDGFDPNTKLGPLVSENQYDKVNGFIQRALKEGLDCVAGGKRPPHLAKGYFIEPTIFVDTPTDAEVWRDEIFGPVLAIRRFRDEAEAVSLANDNHYGLAAAVMGADNTRVQNVARKLRAGIVWINCSQPTFSEAPWGGYKSSGIGRELGVW
ncbi:MAG: aldehyde dehydrogenase family protein, partial [Parvularcula sp.]|nr:aldehyde dehydrogenase family protein [Parvularcula sp.]